MSKEDYLKMKQLQHAMTKKITDWHKEGKIIMHPYEEQSISFSGTDEECKKYLLKAEEDLIYMMIRNIESLWKYKIITIKQREKLLDKLQKKAAELGIYFSRKKYEEKSMPVLQEQNEK